MVHPGSLSMHMAERTWVETEDPLTRALFQYFMSPRFSRHAYDKENLGCALRTIFWPGLSVYDPPRFSICVYSRRVPGERHGNPARGSPIQYIPYQGSLTTYVAKSTGGTPPSTSCQGALLVYSQDRFSPHVRGKENLQNVSRPRRGSFKLVGKTEHLNVSFGVSMYPGFEHPPRQGGG